MFPKILLSILILFWAIYSLMIVFQTFWQSTIVVFFHDKLSSMWYIGSDRLGSESYVMKSPCECQVLCKFLAYVIPYHKPLYLHQITRCQWECYVLVIENWSLIASEYPDLCVCVCMGVCVCVCVCVCVYPQIPLVQVVLSYELGWFITY